MQKCLFQITFHTIENQSLNCINLLKTSDVNKHCSKSFSINSFYVQQKVFTSFPLVSFHILHLMTNCDAVNYVKKDFKTFGKIVRELTGQKLLKDSANNYYTVRDLNIYLMFIFLLNAFIRKCSELLSNSVYVFIVYKSYNFSFKFSVRHLYSLCQKKNLKMLFSNLKMSFVFILLCSKMFTDAYIVINIEPEELH